MRVLIVEDETSSYENLREILREIDPDIEMVGNTESVMRKGKILIPYKDRLIPVNLCDVSFFYTTDKATFVYLSDGTQYSYTKTLDQIMTTLDTDNFFRANKQFIIRRESVVNITIWFDSRLLVMVDTEVPERIYIKIGRAHV